MECAKANQVKASLSLSDQFVVQTSEDNLLKVIGDSVDLLFCNSDEVRSFTKTHNTEDVAEQLENIAKKFVITRGAGGSLSYDGPNMVQTTGVSANAVDTNGVGDMFAGAFVYALAAKFAN